jgi:sulfur-carrier protein adenylyltransferase/sulfurtransferase
MAMTPEQRKRYSRQLILPEVGFEGQERLLNAKVLIVGLGGLGSPVALYLCAAGVGHLGLLDDDVVDTSNLQRQVLYSTAEAGHPKVTCAAERLRGLNPEVTLTEHPVRLCVDNALDLISQYDLVIDGTDNFPTRYLVNDACVLTGKTNVYGSILRFEGQVSVLAHAQGPCYRCLFPNPPLPGEVPNCAQAGVIGALPGLIGTAQAAEAIKLILGTGEPLIGRLWLMDALRMQSQVMNIKKNPDCPLCGAHPSIHTLKEIPFACASAVNQDDDIESLTPREAAQRLQQDPQGTVLLDVRTAQEVLAASIDGAVHIPLDQLESRLGEVQVWRDKTIIIYCHVGIRSLTAARLLRDRGITRIVNMTGGIERWQHDMETPD